MSKVYLNRFPLAKLGDKDKKVQIYQCNFKSPIEPGKEFYSKINNICYRIGYTSGVRFGSNIITKKEISSEYLSNKDNKDWTLQHQGSQILDTANIDEKNALERL